MNGPRREAEEGLEAETLPHLLLNLAQFWPKTRKAMIHDLIKRFKVHGALVAALG